MEEIKRVEDSRTGDKVDITVSVNGVLIMDTTSIKTGTGDVSRSEEIFPNGFDSDQFTLMTKELGNLYGQFSDLIENEEFMDQLVENTNSREPV